MKLNHTNKNLHHFIYCKSYFKTKTIGIIYIYMTTKGRNKVGHLEVTITGNNICTIILKIQPILIDHESSIQR